MEKITGVSIIDEEIKAKLSLRNIYNVLNEFIIPIITKEEQDFLLNVEDYLIKEVEPKIDLTKDVYELFPLLGKKDLIQRLNPCHNLKHVSMRYEILLAMAISILDPELDLARVVTGVIFTNPCFQYGKSDRVSEILEEVLSGKKIGCICITEKEHGSDAVNMSTTIKDMGDHLILNGEKIFTTNGPVADYFIVYAVDDPANPKASMYQVIVERGFEGLETHRLGIQSVPRVQIGQTIFKNVKIPKENVLGPRGRGQKNLFEGLLAERNGIIGSSLGIAWLVAIKALIYTNMRKQFNRPLYDFQGVSFPLTELFTELMAATDLGFRTSLEYEKTLKYNFESKFTKYNAAFVSGTKFLASNLAHKISYEAQQLCGGVAFTDNMRIDKALEVAKVQEIIGGARNIQLYLVSRAIKHILRSLT